MRKTEIQKLFANIPTLTTDRLVLRKVTKADAEDMFEYSRLDKVTEYLRWYSHPDISHTRRHLSMVEREYRIGCFYDWGIVERATGKLIGTCGFTRIDTYNFTGEIGYVLNPRYWSQGLASEAVRRIIRFGFEQLSLHRIEAKYIIGNEKSRAVMERCGMRFEGVARSSMLIKGEFRDIGVCSVISSEYDLEV